MRYFGTLCDYSDLKTLSTAALSSEPSCGLAIGITTTVSKKYLLKIDVWTTIWIF